MVSKSLICQILKLSLILNQLTNPKLNMYEFISILYKTKETKKLCTTSGLMEAMSIIPT